MFAALIPGLGWLRGTQAWVILAGVGASIPLGPWNMAVLWVVIRGWGLGVQETTGGIALYGIFDQLSRLAMGVVGAIVLVVAERNGESVGSSASRSSGWPSSPAASCSSRSGF